MHSPRSALLVIGEILALSSLATAFGKFGLSLGARYNRLDDLAFTDILQGTGLEQLPASEIWVETGIQYLDKKGDIQLSCDAANDYVLTFDPKVLDANAVAQDLLHYPFLVDSSFGLDCQALVNQSVLGPISSLTPAAQRAVKDDTTGASAVLRPIFVEEVQPGRIEFTAAVGDYHDFMGTFVPSDTAELDFLQPGHYPDDIAASRKRHEKRSFIVGILLITCRLTQGANAC
jgi:hypothetical protein